MKSFKLGDIIIVGVTVVVAVISFMIGMKLGLPTKAILYIVVGIGLAIYCAGVAILKMFSDTKSNKQGGNVDASIGSEEIPVENVDKSLEMSITPKKSSMILDKYSFIKETIQKIEEAEIDQYTLAPGLNATTIEDWEKSHMVTLPSGLKEWLTLCNGLEIGTSATIYELKQICACDFPEWEDCFILGEYIGDGSLLLIDQAGGFYYGDHVTGKQEVAFEDFLDDWVINTLKEDLQNAGIA